MAAFDQSNPTYSWLKQLIQLRKDEVTLRRGSFQTRWSTRSDAGDDYGIYAFERRYEEEAALVVMNLFPTRASRTTSGGSAMVVGFEPGLF